MEIVIALAVISIGLIAVVGLIPQGVQSARDAADNTLAATIVQDTFNTLRQQALSSFNLPSLLAAQPAYYDVQGTNAINIATDPQDAYFHVVVNPQLSPSVPGLYLVTATVTWPDKPGFVGALNSNIFFTTIANYQN